MPNPGRFVALPTDFIDAVGNHPGGSAPAEAIAGAGKRFVAVRGVPVVGDIVIDMHGYYGSGPTFVASVGRSTTGAEDIAEALNAQVRPHTPGAPVHDEEPF